MRGIVILSIFDWWYHSHGHSDIQLARAFAKRMPVLFVNSIGMRLPRPGTATSPIRRIGRKLRSTAHFFRFVDPEHRLAVLTPLSLPFYSGTLGKIISVFVGSQIKSALRVMGIANPIVLVTLPSYAPIALKLRREALLYNRSDKHSEFRGVNKALLLKLEQLLFSRADAVLYASRALYESEKGKLAERAVLIGHGLDTEIFITDGEVAPELMNVPRPRVGFFGSLSEQAIDLDLLGSVARLCPQVNFVLGGPTLGALERLRQEPNVYLLPGCSHQEMPARWRGLDVALLPYKKTEWGLASEPIKLNEILAMGIPAVGSPLPAFLRHGEFIRTARDAESFAEAIQQILSMTTGGPDVLPRVRKCKTSFESWDRIAQRVDQLARDVSSRSV